MDGSSRIGTLVVSGGIFGVLYPDGHNEPVCDNDSLQICEPPLRLDLNTAGAALALGNFIGCRCRLYRKKG